MQLVEAVVVEIIEERLGADRMVGHLEIVNAVVPVVAESLRSFGRSAFCACCGPYRTMRLRQMQRDLRRLADTKFDVIVVGAGFYGVTAAWDAAQRGLSVAIIDKDDFGAATSFNNLKTLHGGLRSLQALNFRRCGCSSASAARWRGSLPHLVRPLPFVVPTTRNPTRSATGDAARAGDQRRRRARSQSRACPIPARTCPPATIVSRDEALRLNPVVAPERRHRRRGLVRLPDAQHRSRHAVVPAVGGRRRRVRRELRAGAAASCSRTAASPASTSRTRSPTKTFAIRGSVVVNAAGPWAAGLLVGSSAGRAGRAAAAALARDEHRHAQGRERPCLRRAGQRPLPVHGAMARRVDARHQPRRARRHRRPAEGVALGSRGVPQGRARRIPARQPDRRRRPADPSRPAADGLRRRARTSGW